MSAGWTLTGVPNSATIRLVPTVALAMMDSL